MLDQSAVQGTLHNLENTTYLNNSGFMHKKKKLASSIKIETLGAKVIRIEIYDADQFDNFQKSVCHCNAEICAQHIVQNVFSDDIYIQVKDILKSIDTNQKCLKML